MGSKCPKCGAETFDDDKFCPNCGASLSSDKAAPAESAPSEKVGSATVAATDRITCEVCDADYHAIPGNKNDCPLCNAPGGKGIQATVGSSLAGNPLAPQVEALGKTVSQLSGRVAQLEAALTELSTHVKAGS